MADPFPAIAEAAATGETAELFADIRATVGVSVVNLVWRHLATMDSALPWAWTAVKPLYLQGIADRAAARFREGMNLPALGSLAGGEPPTVDDVLASYDHSNTINLFALGALVAWLRGETATEGEAARGPRLPAPDVTLPKLASHEDVSPDVWALVLRLNRFGDKEQVILASMYRHLAHAPTFRSCGDWRRHWSRSNGMVRSSEPSRPIGKTPRSGRGCSRARSTRHQRPRPIRSRQGSQRSWITPSARWSPSAVPFAWRELLMTKIGSEATAALY